MVVVGYNGVIHLMLNMHLPFWTQSRQGKARDAMKLHFLLYDFKQAKQTNISVIHIHLHAFSLYCQIKRLPNCRYNYYIELI